MTEADLPRLHNDAIKGDPFISRALGPAAKIERMRAAPLRLGSQGVPKTYDDHLLIIGDAAGCAPCLVLKCFVGCLRRCRGLNPSL